MSHGDIIRAWKDEVYRLSLSEAERAQLPENPAGCMELTEAELAGAAGAGCIYTGPNPFTDIGSCTCFFGCPNRTQPASCGLTCTWFCGIF